jgi:putative membrane protein
MTALYPYIKALHIIFIVTWFSGMFYVVRLFIYNTEAGEKTGSQKDILRAQFTIMLRRLWLGITWPSAVLTLLFGPWIWLMMGTLPTWLFIKLILVAGLYAYHFSLHLIYKQQMKGIFKYSSQQLRIWNEVATLFLFAIVLIAVVKDSLNWLGALIGFGALVILLMAAIRIYKLLRSRRTDARK